MKRDGRTLNHATLEVFRVLALRRVKEGEKPSEVVKSLGMNRTSIYRWLRAAPWAAQVCISEYRLALAFAPAIRATTWA
jgi:hypothetical protein